MLAERSGLTRAAIHMLESGVRQDPHLSTLEFLAFGLDLPTSALLEEERP